MELSERIRKLKYTRTADYLAPLIDELADEVEQLEEELLQYKADLRATDIQVAELEAMLKQAAKDAYRTEIIETWMLPLELEANPWIGAKQYKEDWIEAWLCALKEGG